MLNHKQLSGAIRFALFAGAASALAAPAFAQEQNDEAKTLDRIEVTGSLIRRADVETTQPVQVISRADIEKTGLNNLYDVLNNITSSDGSGLSTVTTQTNGSDGSQQISLRGLGADRTLVLVDGKRWATDLDGTVDLSTIPLAIIERIDVLKDGASAIYGSDAIAGVVNVITRKDYDGAQARVYFGQTNKGDGDQSSTAVTIGASGERSSVVLSASTSAQDPIFAGDREVSRFPVFGCEEVRQIPGAVTFEGLFCGSGFPAGGSFGGLTLNPNANLADGITPADFIPFSNNLRYNFSPVNYLQQPARRSNLFAYGRFDITDNLSAYLRTSYTKRTSTQQLAEVPLSIANSGANGPQWQFPVTANSIYNPFGVQFNSAGFRMVPAGGRRPSYDYDIFAIQAGLEGNFEFADRFFNWELMAQRNDGQYDSVGENYINLFNLRNAVGQSGYNQATGELYCGASYATRIRNCVPFNIFGGPTLGLGAPIPGATDGRRITAADVQAMLNYITYTQVSTSGNTTVNYSGLLSGDLVELPGGMAGFAVGFEYRKDTAFDRPDTLVSSGGSSDNFSEATRGGTEVQEYFAEIVLPLVKDVFLAKELELSAAIRKSSYEAAGIVGTNYLTLEPGEPSTSKVGLRWKPIDELLVRASWGETFRAPSASDLFSGGGESFPSATDPCRSVNATAGTGGFASADPAIVANCLAAGVPTTGAPQPNSQIRSLVGGNPFLEPENGENYTVGLVWSPDYVDGLDVSVDWWRVTLENVQSAVSANTVLQRCYNPSAVLYDPALYCNFVSRIATGQISQIRTTTFNAALSNIVGIDTGISYRWDMGDWGALRTKLDSTYLRKSEFQSSEFSAPGDSVGLYTGQGGNWKWRHNLSADWTKGDWTVSYTARAMSRLEDTGGCFIGVCSTGDYFAGDTENYLGWTTYHDMQVTWRAPWDGSVSVGGRNIFGKEPPKTANSFAHSFDASYDLPGGAFWYASYTQDF